MTRGMIETRAAGHDRVTLWAQSRHKNRRVGFMAHVRWININDQHSVVSSDSKTSRLYIPFVTDSTVGDATSSITEIFFFSSPPLSIISWSAIEARIEVLMRH